MILRRAGAVLAALLAAAAGCGNRAPEVEVLSGPRPGAVVVRTAASDETFSHFQRIGDSYAARHNVRFEVTQTQSGNILGLLRNGTVDLGVASRNLLADTKETGISYIPFAFDGVAFHASRDAKVTALTSAQIRGILEGRIGNWKEVGGADRRINVIARPPYSSVTRTVAASLFGGDFPAVSGAFVLETAESAYQAMRTLHSYLSYAPMARTIVEPFHSVALTVNGHPPLMSNVPKGIYPARLEYGILFRNDAPKEIREFANHLVSLEGMHVLASMGLVPAPRNMSLSECHCRETEGVFAPSRNTPLAGQMTIAVVPERGVIEQEKRYAGICRAIADGMGVKTTLKHLPSYGRVVEEFGDRRIDAAFVGSLVYAKLHERFGVVPLARPETDGVSHYRGIILVREGSGISGFAGLKGRSFACVPETSAGELFPMTLIGVSRGWEAYFSGVVPASSHDEAIDLLIAGRVDGAAVKDRVFERRKAAVPDLGRRLKVLAASDLFPENALVASPGLGEAQRKKLLGILLSLDRSPEGRKALSAMGTTRFVPTAHADYAGVYRSASAVEYGLAGKR